MATIEENALIVYQAMDTATDIAGLGEMSIDEAYAVQRVVVGRQLVGLPARYARKTSALDHLLFFA